MKQLFGCKAKNLTSVRCMRLYHQMYQKNQSIFSACLDVVFIHGEE